MRKKSKRLKFKHISDCTSSSEDEENIEERTQRLHTKFKHDLEKFTGLYRIGDKMYTIKAQNRMFLDRLEVKENNEVKKFYKNKIGTQIPPSIILVRNYIIYYYNNFTTPDKIRSMEREYITNEYVIESEEYRFQNLCGVVVPTDVIRIILRYLNFNKEYPRLSMVSKYFLMLLQYDWNHAIWVDYTRVDKIPYLVMKQAKQFEIVHHAQSLSKSILTKIFSDLSLTKLTSLTISHKNSQFKSLMNTLKLCNEKLHFQALRKIEFKGQYRHTTIEEDIIKIFLEETAPNVTEVRTSWYPLYHLCLLYANNIDKLVIYKEHRQDELILLVRGANDFQQSHIFKKIVAKGVYYPMKNASKIRTIEVVESTLITIPNLVEITNKCPQLDKLILNGHAVHRFLSKDIEATATNTVKEIRAVITHNLLRSDYELGDVLKNFSLLKILKLEIIKPFDVLEDFEEYLEKMVMLDVIDIIMSCPPSQSLSLFMVEERKESIMLKVTRYILSQTRFKKARVVDRTLKIHDNVDKKYRFKAQLIGKTMKNGRKASCSMSFLKQRKQTTTKSDKQFIWQWGALSKTTKFKKARDRFAKAFIEPVIRDQKFEFVDVYMPARPEKWYMWKRFGMFDYSIIDISGVVTHGKILNKKKFGRKQNEFDLVRRCYMKKSPNISDYTMYRLGWYKKMDGLLLDEDQYFPDCEKINFDNE